MDGSQGMHDLNSSTQVHMGQSHTSEQCVTDALRLHLEQEHREADHEGRASTKSFQDLRKEKKDVVYDLLQIHDSLCITHQLHHEIRTLPAGKDLVRS